MPSFGPAVAYPAGHIPEAVLAADFDGDGRLDLAVANYSSSSVSVLLGNGNGTFQSARNSATGTWPVSAAAGDFDADGHLDLATANSGSGDVSVLLGNGDGTFRAPNTIGLYPTSVAVGDFDADGHLDIGVTTNDSPYGYGVVMGGAAVLLGNGDGSFAAQDPVWFNYGRVTSGAVADFDGDGHLDYAVVSPDNWAIDVGLGDGTGSFRDVIGVSVGSAPSSVTAGDVNADGKIDLLATCGDSVCVMLGDGQGAFGAAQSYAVGGPFSVAIADFNGDGKADLVTANEGAGTIGVLLGNGLGSFGVAESYPVGSEPQSLAVGDFNGDDSPDVAVANERSDDVSVLLNDGSWPPPGAPSASIGDATVAEGNTGTTTATFTVSLSAAYGQPVTVHYETAPGNGGATAGTDYVAASGVVTFAPGETSRTVTVAVIGDRVPEDNEGFQVLLGGATNTFVTDFLGVGTILDDEPRVSVGDATVTEGNTGTRTASFTVSLSAAYDAPVTVTFATGAGSATVGSDYQAVSGAVTIPAGRTTGTVNVPVIGDRVGEPDETFAVDLTGATYAAVSDGHGVGTIADDEPHISVGDVALMEGRRGKTTRFMFTIRLSVAYDQPVTVSFSTADLSATVADGDYVSRSGTLTFAPGERTKNVVIEVNGDNKRESIEYFYLDLFDNSPNSWLDKGRGVGNILNDD